jgi:hypothetical protein
VSYNVLQCYVRLAFDTRLWKWLASSSFNYGKALGSSQEDSSHRLWKWLAVLPIYGTACATVSYALCNCVLRLMEMASIPPHLWNCLCNCVLRFVQLYLTAYGNG